MKLKDFQIAAIKKMSNGCILNGGVGSGKSLTSIGYYYICNGGRWEFLETGKYFKMINPKDLYIITTAQKRDNKEWEMELSRYLLSTNPDLNVYKNKVVVDSWNNIPKYKNVTGAFFILDEQRVKGYGTWVDSFLKIARSNNWILLSATPGDTWTDYMPVFIANGFFRNKTQFQTEHVIFDRFAKYPKIDRYINEGRLIRLRNRILIDMDFDRKTIAHHETVWCEYDIWGYKDVMKRRWDPFKDEPIQQASSLCYILRRVVNTSDDRQILCQMLCEDHPKCIIFYNFDYELEILMSLDYEPGTEIAQYNGHKHQPIPDSERWVYLVQYTAGNAGWNCIKTDTIIFYSQNYSYSVMEQSCGRIDRLNTPYTDLYYYHLKSRSGIDLAIDKAIRQKKKFNEGHWVSSLNRRKS